ncbi:MAG: DUF86 domain-containing protein [Actinobacteria bacterium]|nr:DUF86 domain-containing protein [Actinomycetota bacterium]
MDMLLAAEDAQAFISGMTQDEFGADTKSQYAVVRALEILGEASRAVPEGIRDAHPEIPWADMTGMRNRLIHAYFEVNFDIVWRVVTEELPGLVEQLRAIAPREDDA